MQKKSFFYDFEIKGVTKQRKIYSKLPEDSVFNIVIIVLEKMKTRIIRVEKCSGFISTFKDWSFSSNGEVITICIVRSENPRGCAIVIQSESAFQILWDHGVNDRNLNTFLRLFFEIERSLVDQFDEREI